MSQALVGSMTTGHPQPVQGHTGRGISFRGFLAAESNALYTTLGRTPSAGGFKQLHSIPKTWGGTVNTPGFHSAE